VLARHGSRKIIIGKDTRISGYMLESALEAGLAAAGLSASLRAQCQRLQLHI
jgi:phosphoglucosamine mutase